MDSFMELLLDFLFDAYAEFMTHIFPKNKVRFKYYRLFVGVASFLLLLSSVALCAWGCVLLGGHNLWGIVPIVIAICIPAGVIVAGCVAVGKKSKRNNNRVFTQTNREEHPFMTYYMNLNPGPFAMIAGGHKIYELRLWDEKRSQIAVGDTLVFTHTEDPGKQLHCKVKALHRFANFAELYASLPLDKCGYLPEEIPTADPSDMDIYYSSEKQAMYGVVAIEIELL